MPVLEVSPGFSVPGELLLDLHRTMWRIRLFESRIPDLFKEGLIRGTTHSYLGQEAVGTAVCAALQPGDYFASTHRGHGHVIAKGGDMGRMMAELLGRMDGYCRGKGGSMHIADVDRGMLGANGIVGGGVGLATGAALSAKLRRSGQVSVCSFGDGAANQGVLYECMNIAANWQLPVIYLCENNQWAMSMRQTRANAEPNLHLRATGFGLPGVNVDGMDVLAVYRAAVEAVDRARRGDGPTFLVATTYRYLGHHIADPLNYRDKAEPERWRQEKDPLTRFECWLIEHGVAARSDLDATVAAVKAEVEAAVVFAKQSPEPPLSELLTDVFAE